MRYESFTIATAVSLYGRRSDDCPHASHSRQRGQIPCDMATCQVFLICCTLDFTRQSCGNQFHDAE